MPLNVAVVMDPIAGIKIAKDSTFAMLLEAQRRGHRLFYVEPGSLSAVAGRACGRLASLAVQDDPSGWYRLTKAELRPLSDMDVVLMRTDPPVDSAYLHDSILLDLAREQGVLVVNDPRGLRDLNEKLAALLFPDCCPPTVVSRDAAVLREFIASHGLCVLKPLDGMGGRSIFVVTESEDTVMRVDVDGRGQVTGTAGHSPAQALYAGGFVWVASRNDHKVYVLDPETLQEVAKPIPVGLNPIGMVARGSAIWVIGTGDNSLTRIDYR